MQNAMIILILMEIIQFMNQKLNLLQLGNGLTRNANKQYKPFGFIKNKEYIFDRITEWDDITSIDITYKDDTIDHITVTWTGNSDYNNDSQHSLLTPQGNLIIVIGNSVEDYLHKKDLTVEDIDNNCKFYIKIK